MDACRLYVKLFHYVHVVVGDVNYVNSDYKTIKHQLPTMQQNEVMVRAAKCQNQKMTMRSMKGGKRIQKDKR